MKRQLFFFILLATIATGATTLYARQSTTGNKGEPAVVNFEAKHVVDRLSPAGNSLATLSGDVIIKSKDATLNTQNAIYNGDTQIATAPNRLRLDDEQNTLLADKGVAYYSTRNADFSGNVVINARPKQGKDGATATKGSLRRNFKDPVTITCTKVRYNWLSKKGVLTGDLTIKQKNRTITGDRGLYDGVSETVTLVGNIKSRRPTGEKLDVAGDKARVVAHFTSGNEYVEIFPDPAAKNPKALGEIPVRDKGNGEVEMIDSVEVPTAPVTPSPAPDPNAAPPEPTPPLPAPNGRAKP